MRIPFLLGLLLPLSLCPADAAAQLMITGSSPARNAPAVAPGAPVRFTFSQPISPASASAASLRVFSAQRGGRLAGTYSGGGTNQLTFQPATALQPGETLMATLTTQVMANGSSLSLAAPQVSRFTVRSGVGPGVFSPAAALTVGAGPAALVAADVDNDGDTDLLTANYSFSIRAISLQLNNGRGQFSAAPDIPLANPALRMAAADVDGDGDLDLLVAVALADGVELYLNDGAAHFTPAAFTPVDHAPQGLVVGDVDGDGDLDLITGHAHFPTLSVRFNDGAGNFSPGLVLPPQARSGGQTLSLFDADNDGDLDVLASNLSTTSLQLLRNDGNATFNSPLTVWADSPVAIAPADVNGDGYLDLISANLGTVSVALNDGRGNFGTNYYIPLNEVVTDVKAVDADGDGDLDFICSSYTGNSNLGGRVHVGLNTGAGTFTMQSPVAAQQRPVALAAADFDGDGDLDMAVANASTGSVSPFFNGGLPTTTRPRLAAQSLDIYPNPAHTNVTVRAPAFPSGSAVMLVLYNSLGQEVQRWPLLAGNAPLQLDLAGVSPGTYLVRVLGGPAAFSQRLVVE